MGFLTPLFLVAGIVVAVPVLLHLFQRNEARRFAFPALRYLRKAEKEHARTIRLRQLLLLLLRVGTLFLVVLAGARLYLPGDGGGHEPTALAIVLDNSASTGVVDGDLRALDRLKALALETLARAGDDDRIWVIRAGEAWDVAMPESPEEARARIEATEVVGGAADLAEALARATTLVLGAGLEAREVHLLSDLQATSFPEDRSIEPDGNIRFVWYDPGRAALDNRAVTRISLAGGVPPLAGERTELAVAVVDPGAAPGDSVTVRLFVGGRMRGAALAPPGTSVILSAGPFARGLVGGYVEVDPDALRVDDRRHFAFRVRPPTPVGLSGASGSTPAHAFVEEALAVLDEAGRIRRVAPGAAELLVSMAGAGLDSAGDGTGLVVLPPGDPTLLPALNRRLARAGIPWQMSAREAPGEAALGSSDLPLDLGGVRVYRHYALAPADGARSSLVRAALPGGDPWLVAGEAARGPYLLLASPLDPDATNLPVSASIIPFLEWMFGGWSVAGSGVEGLAVGDTLPVSGDATSIEAPDGTILAAAGTPTPLVARATGLYRVLRGDSLLDLMAVNVGAPESDLTPADRDRVERLLGEGAVRVADASRWGRSVFGRGQGPEVWRPLLVTAVLLLLLESWIAASGRGRGERAQAQPGGRGEIGSSQGVKRGIEESRAEV